MAQLISKRITEMYGEEILGRPLQGARDLLFIQDKGLTILPVDHCTDCMDLFELCIGSRGLPTDKNQRVIIMSLREDRLKGYIRTMIHLPTSIMVADGLTKRGFFRSSCGWLRRGTSVSSFRRRNTFVFVRVQLGAQRSARQTYSN